MQAATRSANILNMSTVEAVQQARRTRRSRQGSQRLPAAIAELEHMPALAEARDRLVRELSSTHPSSPLLVDIIESDIALVATILRLANAVKSPRRGRVFSIPTALELLTFDQLGVLVKRLAVVDVLEQVPGWEVVPDALRRHSVATQHVADELAGDAGADARAELSVAAVLHDVGKLVLGVAFSGYAELQRAKTGTPDERVHRERVTYGVDHAMVGGVLIRRWGLPNRLAATVSAHHDPEPDGPGAIVQLADLLVHYGDEARADPDKIFAAAVRVGISKARLHDLMSGLAGAGGMRPRVASPLTKGERAALQGIARGQSFKEIAFERGSASSTVRTQLHAASKKLGVGDRARAVLVATESGWL